MIKQLHLFKKHSFVQAAFLQSLQMREDPCFLVVMSTTS